MTCATCTHPLACQNHGGCIDETEARLRKEREAKPICPLGEGCDLTIAWMLGYEAAKDKLRAVMEWQPIETAPSMKAILVSVDPNYGPRRAVIAIWAPRLTLEAMMDYDGGEYDEDNDCYYAEEGWYEDQFAENLSGDAGYYRFTDKVTHWMPLPAPPGGVE